MRIKITKKGNVKVDGTKYVFVPKGLCEDCAFKGDRELCEAAPCYDSARERLGLAAVDGHFAKKEAP